MIDSWMNCLSGSPRFLASPTTAVPRFGPTVPVVPAAASVWHVPQPPGPVKTALPAVAAADGAPPAEDELVLAVAPGPLFAPPTPSALPAVGADGAAPGSPASPAFGGGVPRGGEASAG